MRTITTSPHFHSGDSTQKIMLAVVYAMMPSCIWGVYIFGLRALLVLAVSVAASVITEHILNMVSGEKTIWDCSAIVTGLLVGMNMSPSIPIFIPILASVFSIAVVKWTFGGLGCNWANPAIVGRIFVFFSFSSAMSEFKAPRTLAVADSISSASPLSLTKTVIASGSSFGKTSLQILAENHYPVTQFAQNLSNKTGINAYNIDAFLGNMSGCIGEVSALLLLAGGIYLLVKKVISYSIPLSYFLSFSIFTWIFGGIPNGLGYFHGEVMASLFRGGLFLAIFFMATDMVTSPITNKGMMIYGAGCGFFTFLFRTFGSLPEAASVAILLMNIATPTIDKFCRPVLFGSAKKGAAK